MQNDLRQSRLQIELLKSTKTQLEQAQEQNQRYEIIKNFRLRNFFFRLHSEINALQNELANKKDFIVHCERQIGLLEKQLSSRSGKFN